MSCVHFFGIICTMITFLEFFHIVHAVFVYVFILKILNLLSLVIVCLTSLIFLLPVLKILSGKMHVFLKLYISFFVSALYFNVSIVQSAYVPVLIRCISPVTISLINAI